MGMGTDLSACLERVERCRIKLLEASERTGGLSNDEVLKLSVELDRLLTDYERLRRGEETH
ncbi:MAG: aspartyl-phosphate phosphatase Spo0E family protein [Paenibacillaceae bacterium]|nr:aspartyl-phosphate phosphatase Spo0E family protein [Paenibacillaceae bacterium]